MKLEKTDAGFAITAVHLDVVAKIPGRQRGGFRESHSRRQGGLPGVQSIERANYHGRQARGITSLKRGRHRRFGLLH